MLYDGIIVANGTRAEIMAKPHPVLKEFAEASGTIQFGQAGSAPA
jgi:ABC-type transporter Mla maintaining outer membrane lipid asymmetry ATPase subunit MlaF